METISITEDQTTEDSNQGSDFPGAFIQDLAGLEKWFYCSEGGNSNPLAREGEKKLAELMEKA
jgi:hypothetical protein